ncbi:MAG: sigma-54-dependent Fis family transcriptional regulator [Planctomycetaceae bacterium]|jgi:transcriptional regulator with GAF, ATPase, and Fis domain|nr:sigma-54-dependent Fis family transcriptional regulator [Planctomycetaceae bacterium]MBT7256714.1 sigma-54-dependent Fis family transcriptional regulator [Planctomycetaceae bacterium]
MATLEPDGQFGDSGEQRPHSALEVSDNSTPLGNIIGNSLAMRKVYQLTRKVAKSDASVLLLGETGTGKELVANAIHQLSHRSNGPFVKVNCGALSESLLESELFGHVRGSFTGAVNNRTGRFEAAHSGTIFLDEINSTSLELQVKLLRVLQEREFERVGDTQTISVDTRVIAASNRDLMSEVRAGHFREDVYWRLNVVPVEIPPLRDRREDIPQLLTFFLQQYNEVNDRYVVHIQPAVIEALQQYTWPGNVRELQNYVERAVVLASGDEFTADLLPPSVLSNQPESVSADGSAGEDLAGLSFRTVQQALRELADKDGSLHSEIIDRIERELIQQVLAACGGTRTKAAIQLGINRNTLHKKINDLGINE